MTNDVIVAREDKILRITMNRPAKKNALTGAMYKAMQDALVKQVRIATRAATVDTVELTVADTGCGVTPEDREKLFLPYFSTKGRGTGLGLAIVNHILADHNAHIRVEDNLPAGTRFIIEVPVAADAGEEARAAENVVSTTHV